MDKKIKLLIIITITSLFLTGCANEKIATSKTKVTSKVREKTPEESLVSQISDGRIVEVYEEFVRLREGGTKENWMIIKNAKQATDTFKIIPCEGCSFDKESATIEPGKYEIIRFTVSGAEGQKEIKVKDGMNNAYGYSKISVIIEQ
jgi:hypothetical protein